MSHLEPVTISNIPEISAIYYALLQSGYPFYMMEREKAHIDSIHSFTLPQDIPLFFSAIKQNTCEVYPYWPRAFILETASFYLLPDHSDFQNFHSLYKKVMSFGNISHCERDHKLWTWLEGFPTALSKILSSDSFSQYLKWENSWIAQQNKQYRSELQAINSCLNMCVSQYNSPVHSIQIVVNPIKCVYSSDYHLNENRFVFCSGAFRVDSVIHEFLHHVIHPAIEHVRDTILTHRRSYENIDGSYYLSGDDFGQLNAFEEYAVRELTTAVLGGNAPRTLIPFLDALI